MGAGKTSVGRQLARQLKRDFVDSDKEIEVRTGVAIPVIFDIEGEEGFRKRETAMLRELCAKHNIVLATGGGAVLKAENRDLMHSDGSVIYLRASIDQLYDRTKRDRNRPLLQTEDPRARIEQLMSEREPLYREVSDLEVDTDGCSVHQVVHRIVEWLDAPS